MATPGLRGHVRPDVKTNLDALEARVRDDLERTAHPDKPWMPDAPTGLDAPYFDVIIAGAGQGGLAIAHALKRDRVDNILVIDQARAGGEGVWSQYARMPTLRSPKEFTGPDLGMPSLTYQSWHEANYGSEDWQALSRISTEDWRDYLSWYRHVLDLPVRNQHRLIDIGPGKPRGLTVQIQTPGGTERFYCRKLVLATGQDGVGQWHVPEPFKRLARHRWASTADDIDFQALKGRRVVVIGQGASASDNAACALEHGAREVIMLVRRPELQRVQPFLWLTFAGFLRHLGQMSDPWRWRFMNRILTMRESIPQPTWDRMARHKAFRVQLDSPLLDVIESPNTLRLCTSHGDIEADFVIVGAGIEIDPTARPELKALAPFIASWGDRYTPPAEQANPRLARFPYLNEDGAFTERVAGTAPHLKDIHDFTIASTLSFGPNGCSINAMNIAVPRLAAGITRGLFADDIDAHWRSFCAYDETVFEPTAPPDPDSEPRN